MPTSSDRSADHFVAPVDDTPLGEVDRVVIAEKPSNLYLEAWRDMRTRPLFYVAGAFILLAVVVALFPWLFTGTAPNDNCQLVNSNSGPAPGHPLGYTKQGCDVYARIIYGTGTSLSVGIIVSVLNALVGVGIGAIAGYYGRWVDAVLSRIGDIFFAIPYILAAILVMSVFINYRNIWTISLAIGVFTWPSTARVLRGQILSVKNSDYVTSAIALGVSRWRILLRHVLPNSITPVIVITTIGLAAAITAEAALSFLGVGLPGTVMSWGNDISQAQVDLRNNPATLIYPSVALSATVLAFIIMGEVLRDALDPKARARR